MDDDRLRRAVIIGELMHAEIKKLSGHPLETFALCQAAETIMELLAPVPADIAVELLRIIANSTELMNKNLEGDN